MIFSVFKKSLHGFHRRARSDESWLAQSSFPSLNNVVTRTYSLGNFQSAPFECSAQIVRAIGATSTPSSPVSSPSVSVSRISSALKRISELEKQLAEGEKVKTQLELRKKQTMDAKEKFTTLLATQKAETERQRSRCRELRARIELAEQEIQHMDRFYALLNELDPYIPGFTPAQPKPLWASEDKEKIVERLKVVSKRPDSLWKPIMDAVVGPVPSEEYMFQINETLRLRKKGREHAKYAKFWEQKTREICHDVECPSPEQLAEVDQTRVDDRGTVLDDFLGILKRGDDCKSRSSHHQVRFAEPAVESASNATRLLIDDRDTTIVDDIVEALKRGKVPPRIGPRYHSTKPTARREKLDKYESQQGSEDHIFTSFGINSFVDSPQAIMVSPSESFLSSNSVSTVRACTKRPLVEFSEGRNILTMLDTNLLQVQSTPNRGSGGERVISDANTSPPRHTRIPVSKSRKPLPSFTEPVNPPNANLFPSKYLSPQQCPASTRLDISPPASSRESATVGSATKSLPKYARTPKSPKVLHSEKIPEITVGKENAAGSKSKTVLSKGRRLLKDFARSK